MDHNESVIESNLHFKYINIQTATNAKLIFYYPHQLLTYV